MNEATDMKCWDGYKKTGERPGKGKNKGKMVNICEPVKEEAEDFANWLEETYGLSISIDEAIDFLDESIPLNELFGPSQKELEKRSAIINQYRTHSKNADIAGKRASFAGKLKDRRSGDGPRDISRIIARKNELSIQATDAASKAGTEDYLKGTPAAKKAIAAHRKADISQKTYDRNNQNRRAANQSHPGDRLTAKLADYHKDYTSNYERADELRKKYGKKRWFKAGTKGT